MLGSAIGTAAAFLVWPETPGTRTRRSLSDALAECERLLQRSLDAAKGKGRELDGSHQAFLARLHSARSTASAAFTKQRETLTSQVRAVERLWHAIIIIDRVVSGDWSPHVRGDRQLQDSIQRVQRQAARRMQALRARGAAHDGPVDLEELEHTASDAARLGAGESVR